MLSDESSLQRLIAAKRCELHDEKRRLGLIKDVEPEESPKSPSPSPQTLTAPPSNLAHHGTVPAVPAPRTYEPQSETRGDNLPPELLRYLRRHSGLPMLLKKGEYSPNNPLLRAVDGPGDAFRGLGDYEERRRQLARARQQEYREHLDRQAKKPAVQPSEDRPPDRPPTVRRERAARAQSPRRLVESATQCGGGPRPCVAVQTDREVETISTNAQNTLTQAERELSPRTVRDTYTLEEVPYIQPPKAEYTQKTPNGDYLSGGAFNESRRPSADERPIKPNGWTAQKNGSCLFLNEAKEGEREREFGQRRRSYDQARVDRPEECASTPGGARRPVRELRHTYLPSLLDSEAVRQRNLKAQQEAAERRRNYQQELRKQIQEQQRIREERKAREKLLEEAEMRRLDQQLRMLQAAQDREIDKHHRLGAAINDTGVEYDRQRNLLARDIDNERAQAFRSYSQPLPNKQSAVKTSKSDSSNLKTPSNLPFHYPSTFDPDKPYSMNIPETSLFSPNCDLESYLRDSLNPDRLSQPKRDYVPSFLRKDIGDLIVKDNVSQDSLPIPLLRHTPDRSNIQSAEPSGKISEAMKRVESKWQVPIVQKTVLRAGAGSEGNKNILTQLGSIRRQLQMEQLKLDKMLSHDPASLK